MSSPLSKELRQKYNVDLCPFERMMKIMLSEDNTKASRLAKWSKCTGRNVTYIEQVQREKANGTTVHVDIHPSKVGITRIKLDKDHKTILGKKAKS